MSRDDLPYCPHCGLSHEGVHQPAEFCPEHPEHLLIFGEADVANVPYCPVEGCSNDLASVTAYAYGKPSGAWLDGEPQLRDF